MEGSALLTAILLFLFAAVVAVPIAQRLGIGAVLGYLIAGIAIGPWGLGFIRDVDEILHFSELGVVFLMFIIGLELNPAKLWQLRRSIFGVGACQVVITAAVLGALLYFTQFSLAGGGYWWHWFGDVLDSDGIAANAGKRHEPQRRRAARILGVIVTGYGGYTCVGIDSDSGRGRGRR